MVEMRVLIRQTGRRVSPDAAWILTIGGGTSQLCGTVSFQRPSPQEDQAPLPESL